MTGFCPRAHRAAVDFGNRDDVAVRRRDEDFFRSIKSPGNNVRSSTGIPIAGPISSSTLRVIPARQPEESGGVSYAPVAHAEDVCRGAFSNLSAFVQEHNLIEARLLRLV